MARDDGVIHHAPETARRAASEYDTTAESDSAATHDVPAADSSALPVLTARMEFAPAPAQHGAPAESAEPSAVDETPTDAAAAEWDADAPRVEQPDAARESHHTEHAEPESEPEPELADVLPADAVSAEALSDPDGATHQPEAHSDVHVDADASAPPMPELPPDVAASTDEPAAATEHPIGRVEPDEPATLEPPLAPTTPSQTEALEEEPVAAPPHFPRTALDAFDGLDMSLPPRVEPEAAATQPVVAPEVTARQAVPSNEPEAPRVADEIEAGTAGAGAIAGMGAARYGPLALDFDLELPSSPAQPLSTFTPEELARIARNKLELAAEYIELGDVSGARTLINEVIESNDAGTRHDARAMLSTLAPLS